MADVHMLTTVDNPFNPFTQYDEWLEFDEEKRYYSNSLLARRTITSDTLSETDQELAREQAIDEIVEENASGMHRKITMSGVLAA